VPSITQKPLLWQVIRSAEALERVIAIVRQIQQMGGAPTEKFA
jgi:hypothetical protein